MAVLDIVSETSRISGQLDVNKLFEKIAFSKVFFTRFCVGDPTFNCVIKSESQPGHERGRAWKLYVIYQEKKFHQCHNSLTESLVPNMMNLMLIPPQFPCYLLAESFHQILKAKMLGGRRGSQFCCYIHYQILFESHIWLILLLNIKGVFCLPTLI